MIEEWLELVNKEEGSEWTIYDINPILAERYKNYCTKHLMALIFEFRNKILLNGGMSDFSILRKYDDWFGIEKV